MEIYEIIDVDKFVESTRTMVYYHFGSEKNIPKNIDGLIQTFTKEEIEEMNNCLSQTESTNILQKFMKKQKNKYTNETRISISDESYYKYIEELNTRMISNMLSKLASQGVLETAFDEEINDFVFWTKEKNENN